MGDGKFLPGNPGKPKGSINHRSRQFLEVLEKHNFCSASAMMDIYKISMEKFIQDSQKEETGQISPMESNAVKYLKIAADMASDLSTYAYPKLKAIEQQKLDVTKDMSPEQRLEAMRHAVQVLELQLKKEEK